jgi:hypothetical protein
MKDIFLRVQDIVSAASKLPYKKLYAAAKAFFDKRAVFLGPRYVHCKAYHRNAVFRDKGALARRAVFAAGKHFVKRNGTVHVRTLSGGIVFSVTEPFAAGLRAARIFIYIDTPENEKAFVCGRFSDQTRSECFIKTAGFD